MVSGRMQCLGSVQHLKSKFGGAYTVELRCAAEQIEGCLELLQSAVPPRGNQASLQLEERHGGFLRLRADKESELSLAIIFSLLEAHKARLQIYDYSVSQCSLEQVFIKFAKQQEEEQHRRQQEGSEKGDEESILDNSTLGSFV
jgi:hypothetical protein